MLDNRCGKKAKVHIQQGASVCVLTGTDVLPKLGFILLESDSDGTAVDCLSKQNGRRNTKLVKTPRPDCGYNNCPPQTVKLITATRVPA